LSSRGRFRRTAGSTNLLEYPGRERDLADQEGEREAERYPDQRGQGKFEQRLKVNPTYGERKQNDDGYMDDVHGKGLLGQEAAKAGLAVQEAAEEGDQTQAHSHGEGAVPERVHRRLKGSIPVNFGIP
jgi:hypothetical protein